jgi:zinc transport system permease protein
MMDIFADPFLARAVAAAVGLAIIAAPLGSVAVWSRMAYFGETMAQASLIGVALALAMTIDVTAGILAATLAAAGLIILASRQKLVPLDSVLGLMHHGALALGIVATALLKGPSVDLMGYLFGDVLAITSRDLLWIYGGGALILAAMFKLWEPLLRMAVHADLAEAEGVNTARVRALFVLLLAVAIAFAVKIAGILLAIAFLVVPAAAARPLASTPERMVGLAALVGIVSALAGLLLSFKADVPAGPAIVLVMALLAGLSLVRAATRG